MELSINKKRISYIDIAKGIGMFLVIWGHIRETGLSNAIVYAFHMPLFFFLAGMTFQKEKYHSVWELIKKRVKTLLIPYIIFSVVTWVVWVVYNLAFHNQVESYWMPLLQTVISQGSGGYLVHNSPLWFVTCLFSVEIIYYFVSKLKTIPNLLVCICLTVVGCFMIKEGSPLRYLPWSLDMALGAIIFYGLGNILSKTISKQEIDLYISKHKILAMILIVVTLGIVVFGAKINGPVSMGHRKLNAEYIFYPLALIGIFSEILLSRLISLRNNRFINYVRWIGQNSFYVMAVQTPIKGIVLVVLAKLLKSSVGELSDSTGYSLIAFLITLVVVTIVVMAIITIKKIMVERISLKGKAS